MEEGNHLSQRQDVVIRQPAGQIQPVFLDAIFAGKNPGDIPKTDAVHLPHGRVNVAGPNDQTDHFFPATEGHFHQITNTQRPISSEDLVIGNPVRERLRQGDRQDYIDQLRHFHLACTKKDQESTVYFPDPKESNYWQAGVRH